MLVRGRTQMSWMEWQGEVGYLSSADTPRSPMWLRPRLDPGKVVSGRVPKSGNQMDTNQEIST